MEKQLEISAYLCKVGVETIVWKEIKIMSINSAANYHENRFSRETINTNSNTSNEQQRYRIQVYNEIKKQSKNLLVYYTKTTVASFCIFFLTY